MRICIIQSNYIPWKGFFDLIGRFAEGLVPKCHLLFVENARARMDFAALANGERGQAIDRVAIAVARRVKSPNLKTAQ
jgi:hypothetical protein